MFIEGESKTEPKPKITKRRSSISLLKPEEPKKPEEPEIIEPKIQSVCIDDTEEKTKKTSLPDKSGNVPPEKPDIEPLIENEDDPEGGTKLTQFLNKCEKLRKKSYYDDEKWYCPREKLDTEKKNKKKTGKLHYLTNLVLSPLKNWISLIEDEEDPKAGRYLIESWSVPNWLNF